MSEQKTTHSELAKSPRFTEPAQTNSRPALKRLPLPKALLDTNTEDTTMSASKSPSLARTPGHAKPDHAKLSETVIPVFPALAKVDPQLSVDAKAQLEADKERLAQVSRENGALGGRPPINTVELAQYCLKNEFSCCGQYTLRHYKNDWYFYKDGCYRTISEEDIDAKVTGCLIRAGIERVSKSLRESVLGNLKSDEFCGLTEDKFTKPCFISTGESADGFISMKNGIINIDEIVNALKHGLPPPPPRNHTPDFFSTTKLPYKYDPAATCPKFETYLEGVQPKLEKREMLQMLAGLILEPDTSFEVAFFLFGEAGTGKTVFMDVLENLIGSNNCCCIPLASFAEKFAIAELTEKQANLVDEAPIIPENGRFSDIESVFKAVSSCRPISVERKFKDPKKARATARCVFTSNNLPRLTDRTNGIWTRVRIIPFKVVFRDTDRQNPHLIDELIEELPGILNWSFKGRVKLYERTSQSQGKRTFPQCSEGIELLAKMREDSDHETTFLKEKTEVNPDKYLEVLKLFDDYVAWTKRLNYRSVGYDRFRDAILRLYPNADFKRKNVPPGVKATVIQGVGWSNK